MDDTHCLFTAIDAKPESWEPILLGTLAPVVRELRGRPELDTLFFARFNEPAWQIRFRVVGARAWVEECVRPMLDARLAPLKLSGTVQGYAFGRYVRELERYGGERGMRLTERIYHLDTLGCLDLMEADSRGELSRTRREYSLLMAERLAGLMGFDRQARLAFYERGYRWALEEGTWRAGDLDLLERRYAALRPALVELLGGETSRSPVAQWGGAVPARIAGDCLRATAPLIEETLAGLRDGTIRQHPVELAWSWAHLHCNRLGVVSVSEAVLRFFMHRLYQEGALDPS